MRLKFVRCKRCWLGELHSNNWQVPRAPMLHGVALGRSPSIDVKWMSISAVRAISFRERYVCRNAIFSTFFYQSESVDTNMTIRTIFKGFPFPKSKRPGKGCKIRNCIIKSLRYKTLNRCVYLLVCQ